MKLNLGCGDRKIYGFTNVDAREEVNPDAIADVAKIHEKFDEVDLIYACHVLEHFNKHQIKDVLDSWYKALKPGGILRLSVPDLSAVCIRYLMTHNAQELQGFLVGGQKNPFDYHYQVFDYGRLTNTLSASRFKEFKRCDWREWDHSYVDDYSQAYLPHMDFQNGRHMSLNLEGTK